MGQLYMSALAPAGADAYWFRGSTKLSQPEIPLELTQVFCICGFWSPWTSDVDGPKPGHQAQQMWPKRLLQALLRSAGLQLIECSAMHQQAYRLTQLTRHQWAQSGHQAPHTRVRTLKVPHHGLGTWNKPPRTLPEREVHTREIAVEAGLAEQRGKTTRIPHRSRTSESQARHRWKWRSRPLKEAGPSTLWRSPSGELRRFMSLFASSSRLEHVRQARRGDRDLRNRPLLGCRRGGEGQNVELHGNPGAFTCSSITQHTNNLVL